MTPRGACINEFTLINNSYNCMKVKLLRIAERTDKNAIQTAMLKQVEFLQKQWEKFMKHCDSKEYFDMDGIKKYQQELKRKEELTSKLYNKYIKPNPNPPTITDITDRVYGTKKK